MSATKEPLLKVTELHKHFPIREGLLIERKVGEVRAVDGVSFDVLPGETLGLVGESGSGKSTTGYCILQLLKPTGSVLFEGTELTELGREDLRRMRREMQIVFQDPVLVARPRMTVGDIVGEPLVVHGIGTRRDRTVRIRDLLDVVGFNPGFTNRYPHEFRAVSGSGSGSPARLALSPKLIVCDEPVSALDVSIQAQILNLLYDLQRDFGLTYLFIAHDLAVIRGMSDRIAVMNRGQLVEIGPAERSTRTPRTTTRRRSLRRPGARPAGDEGAQGRPAGRPPRARRAVAPDPRTGTAHAQDGRGLSRLVRVDGAPTPRSFSALFRLVRDGSIAEAEEPTNCREGRSCRRPTRPPTDRGASRSMRCTSFVPSPISRIFWSR